MTDKKPAGFDRAKAAAEKIVSNVSRVKALIGSASEKADRHKGVLGAIRDDLVTLIALVKAWVTGRYREVPWQTLVLAVAALLYFVNPFDVVPDLLPFVGFLDDATVLGFVIASIRKDLEAFRLWRGSVREQPAVSPDADLT